jgi:hypothetical protein
MLPEIIEEIAAFAGELLDIEMAYLQQPRSCGAFFLLHCKG